LYESEQSLNHGDETKPMTEGNYSIMETMARSHTTFSYELIPTEMPSWDDLVSLWFRISEETSEVARGSGGENVVGGRLRSWVTIGSITCVRVASRISWRVGMMWNRGPEYQGLFQDHLGLGVKGRTGNPGVLITFQYRPFSHNLSKYSNICSSLGQQNKTSNVMPGCWTIQKSSYPTETDFHSKCCH